MNMPQLDSQTMAGMTGQLAGHGLVWAKMWAAGTPLNRIFTTESLFWAAFNIASETISSSAVSLTGSPVAGIVVPAGVQIAALNMYNAPSARVVSRLSSGDVTAVADSPFFAGTLGSVVAKYWA